MPPTRRQFLLASTGGITAFAGCSVRSNPQQSLLVAVNNYTDTRHHGQLLIERDDTGIVRQYLEVPGAESDGWATVETKIGLGEMPGGTRLDVTASFGDGLGTDGSLTLDCSDDYTGDAIYVQIQKEMTVRLNEACYDEFPSDEASQGGLNRS